MTQGAVLDRPFLGAREETLKQRVRLRGLGGRKRRGENDE